MQSTDMIFVILGAFDALAGLASIITGKVYMMGSRASKYTEESLKKYARPNGFVYLFIGIGLVAEALLKEQKVNLFSTDIPLGLIVLVAAAVIAIIIGLASRKILVKK